MPRIVSENSANAKLEVCSTLNELLREKRIFQARRRVARDESKKSYFVRWKPGAIIEIGKHAVIEPYTTFGAGAKLFSVGSFSSVMSQFHTNASIGRYCSIASGVSIGGFRHPVEAVSMSSAVFNPLREFVNAYIEDIEIQDGENSFNDFQKVSVPQKGTDITIGHDCWIGSDVKINRGLVVGHGSVIASGSLVTKNVPPYSIVGGNPAKIIKYRFSREICDALLETEWWNYELRDLHNLPLGNPERFLAEFSQVSHSLRSYTPPNKPLWDSIASIL